MSILRHREDALGGHQKEVSVVQLHVEGDVSVGRVLETPGIPHMPQAAVKLGGKQDRGQSVKGRIKDKCPVAFGL